MPIWIFSLTLAGLLASAPVDAEVITRLPGSARQVALTFDGCESKRPSFLDQAILDILLRDKIPATLFISGRFARHQQAALRALAENDFIEIENHSLDHDNHMERMSDGQIRQQITDNDRLLFEITGRHSRFFRFPAGNYDANSLAIAESLGFRVVHWSFPSGDPAREVSAEKMNDWVLSQVRPGAILIFHINGRGWHTAEALPGIIAELRRRGYGFTTLAEALK